MKIYSVCSQFLQHGGTIACTVTGSRQHSQDLLQGGLEVPCALTFEEGLKDITKTKKLIKKSLAVSAQQKAPVEKRGVAAEKRGVAAEKRGLSGYEDVPSGKKTHTKILDFETESILNGAKVTDLHVHAAQQLLKWQFPYLNDFQPTVLKKGRVLESGSLYLTIFRLYIPVETTGLFASNIGCRNGVVNVYDSVYRSVYKATRAVITNLF